MKYSKLFGKTIRGAPKEATLVSHKLLYQAGFIRESAAGRYYFLPLGWRVHEKIRKIIKEEMDRAGGQEMLSPVLHPLELWKETNRTTSVSFELMRIKDRNGASFALGGTAEEMFVDLVRKMKLSYKDLPFNIYQFSTKFRDELRPRGGLLRVREFVMKDAYSFDRNEEEFKKTYQKMWKTYKRIFDRLGIETLVIEADNGYIGGEYCHEFVYPTEIGESKYLISEDGKYAAHEEVARFKREEKNTEEEEKPLKEIEAKRGTTMEDGVRLHKLPLWQQIKDLLMVNEKGEMILGIIRGDFVINELKLAHLTNSLSLRHATDEEIRAIGSEPGFISPVGLSKKVKVVADISLRTIKNAYGGGNKKFVDLQDINIDRDYKPDIEGDIALAQEGYLTEDGTQKLKGGRGIEVGNIFQLGYHYTHLMKGANFVDEDGKEKPYYMGCYGIGIGRTLATLVEKYHDEKGIVWPENVAPYQAHLLDMNTQHTTHNTQQYGEDIYKRLTEAGIEVLYEDRTDMSVGEKFADADLIGIPIRLLISPKTGSQIEWKERSKKETELISFDEVMIRLNR